MNGIDVVLVKVFLLLLFVIEVKWACTKEPIASWLADKRTEKYFKLAKGEDINNLRLVSKECEGEYEIVCQLLLNKSTPNDVIEFWITKGAWRYGLRQTSFYYGPIDENLRLRILVLCVRHPNVNQTSIIKLSNDILENEKDYFIDHSYPEDDLHLIYDLMNLERLPKELRKKLSDYYSWRKVHGEKNTRCDEYGFIKREYL